MKSFFIYKTTNIQTGMIYIGVHETFNLNDGYLGSGIVLERARKKYGDHNFKREILEFFECAADAYAREAEIVTSEFIAQPFVMNVKTGGRGGFLQEHIQPFNGPHSDETKAKLSRANLGKQHTDASKEKMRQHHFSKTAPDDQRQHAKKASDSRWKDGEPRVQPDSVKVKISESLKGRVHSTEAKLRMKEAWARKRALKK